MEASPVRSRGPSPGTGAHTQAVLREAGFSEDECEALLGAGVAGPRSR